MVLLTLIECTWSDIQPNGEKFHLHSEVSGLKVLHDEQLSRGNKSINGGAKVGRRI